MKNIKALAEAMLRMERLHWAVPLRVDLPNYLRFSRRLDSQLQELVEQWAPKGRRQYDSSRRRFSL